VARRKDYLDADGLILQKVSIPVNRSLKEDLNKLVVVDEELLLPVVEELSEIFSDPLFE
jgi:hypothetical protein